MTLLKKKKKNMCTCHSNSFKKEKINVYNRRFPKVIIIIGSHFFFFFLKNSEIIWVGLIQRRINKTA